MKDTNLNPLVTFAILSYNQEKYIEKAIQGALNQDYNNIEFIFSDDCSADKTSDIIESTINGYCGPHKVVLNRNSTNIGLSDHFNKIMDLATGEIVVVAAGDDISVPNRVSKTIQIFSSHPGATFVSFSDITIDKEGEIISQPNIIHGGCVNTLSLHKYLIGHNLLLSGASRAYKKRVFEVFGPLNSSCPTEDTPYLLRCLMMGFGVISNDVGIYYRRHEGNLSSEDNIQRLNIEKIKRQYIRDVGLAHRAKLITKNQKIKIIRWIYKVAIFRVVSKKLHFIESRYSILIWLFKKYKKISIYEIIRITSFILLHKKK